jgi:hypothetical protein
VVRLRRCLHLVRLRSSAKNRVFGLPTQWGLRLARLRQPDGLELLAARAVHGVCRRFIGEALAVNDLLHERISPLYAEVLHSRGSTGGSSRSTRYPGSARCSVSRTGPARSPASAVRAR